MLKTQSPLPELTPLCILGQIPDRYTETSIMEGALQKQAQCRAVPAERIAATEELDCPTFITHGEECSQRCAVPSERIITWMLCRVNLVSKCPIGAGVIPRPAKSLQQPAPRIDHRKKARRCCAALSCGRGNTRRQFYLCVMGCRVSAEFLNCIIIAFHCQVLIISRVLLPGRHRCSTGCKGRSGPIESNDSRCTRCRQRHSVSEDC